MTAAPEAEAEAGAPNLFAMLLALVGAPAQAADDAATTIAAALPTTPTPPAPVTFAVPAAKPKAAETASQPQSPAAPVAVDPLLLEAAGTETGKSLLRDLGDALIAVNDALDAGKPVDPALEKKLSDAVDAVAAYLGTLAPPPTPQQQIAAVANGAHILPRAATVLPDAPPPADDAPADAPVAAAPDASLATPTIAPAVQGSIVAPVSTQSTASVTPVADTAISALTRPDAPIADVVQKAATAIVPTLPPEITDLLQDLGVDLPAPTATADSAEPTQPTAPSTTPAPTATTWEQAPPALQALGLVIGKLSQRLEPQDPELAKKLDALAESLKSGAVPDDLTAALDLDGSDTDPEVLRIVQALTAPKPAPVTAPAPNPFIAAQLASPDEAIDTEPAKAESAPAAKPAATERPELPHPKLARFAPSAETAPPAQPIDTTPKAEVTPDPMPDRVPDAKPSAAGNTAQPQATAPAAPAAAPTPPAAPAVEAPVPVARVHAAYQAPLQQVNIPQVAFEIARQFEAGNSRFQIRLDPADLGRIDVSLEIEKSGTISARMVVERPETLDLMQRDQRALHQALQQAGLDANKTSLEFSLRQNPFGQQGGLNDGQSGNQPRFGGNGTSAGGDASGAEATPNVNLYRGSASAGGVNLFV